MNLLLDTHVWLWMQAHPRRIHPAVLDLLSDTRNQLLLSAASAWEIAIKFGLGRLALPDHPTRYVPERMRRSGVTPLAVSHEHALAVSDLPTHHRDPFDRLLIAQAQLESLQLVTVDPAFADYDLDVHWARHQRG